MGSTKVRTLELGATVSLGEGQDPRVCGAPGLREGSDLRGREGRWASAAASMALEPRVLARVVRVPFRTAVTTTLGVGRSWYRDDVD